MDPDHEAAECPDCGAQFQLERAVEEFTCPNCDHRFAVRRGEGTRIFEATAGGDCSLFVFAMLMVLIVLASIVGSAGGVRPSGPGRGR